MMPIVPKYTQRRREKYFANCVDFVSNNQCKILKILNEISSYPAAQEEITGALDCLQKAMLELDIYDPQTVESIAVYHPSNMIFYSYVLYCLVPAAFSQHIILRPSHRSAEQTQKLHELFKPLVPQVQIFDEHQRKFTRKASECNVVLFTGHYQNFQKVLKNCSNNLVIFYGSGTNPVVVTNSNNLAQVVTKVIASRIFNSGQDCLCPNAIFLDEQIASQFTDHLYQQLSQIKFGSRNDPQCSINPLVYEGVAASAQQYLNEHRNLISWSEPIDINQNIVQPQVLLSSLDAPATIQEFFCPIFNIIVYKTQDSLINFLLSKDLREQAMGLSIFGNEDIVKKFKGIYSVAFNKTLFEAESGNKPFGGFGKYSSSVSYKGETYCQPVLVSKEVRKFFGKKTSITPNRLAVLA